MVNTLKKVHESVIESGPKSPTLYFIPYFLSFCPHPAHLSENASIPVINSAFLYGKLPEC